MAKKEKKAHLEKSHLKPSGRFYKALIDKFLSFSCFICVLGDVPFSKGITRLTSYEVSLFRVPFSG